MSKGRLFGSLEGGGPKLMGEVQVNPGEFHALLLYYGPRNPAWKRILVVGQEANSDRPVGEHIEPYDLPRVGKKSKVPFWTGSHKAVERAAGFPGLRLRERAIEVGSSPLMYTDASPRSLSVANGRRGPGVTDRELEAHARKLCALPEVQACPVVIISGKKERWEAFYLIAEAAFARAGALVAQVPFYGQGPASTEERYLPLCEPELRARIRGVVGAWAGVS